MRFIQSLYRAAVCCNAGVFLWQCARRRESSAQQPTMPVIGFLSNSGPNPRLAAAFREGLAEAGYVEGRNVTVEYRWANTQEWQRLGELAADLVRLRVRVIVAFGSAATAFAAKRATETIPIVLAGGTDPVTYGLVTSRVATSRE
jgi:putative ABC transport system substrate-binding protein